MKPSLKKQSGFTLIEVVIVLAIAALIMVIVFLAVQGAQRSRRDTATKNDVNRVTALAESFASGNGGKYPTALNVTDFQNNWVRKDITNVAYVVQLSTGTGPVGTIYISPGGTCDSGAIKPGGNKGLAASTTLEAGKYCVTTGQ